MLKIMPRSEAIAIAREYARALQEAGVFYDAVYLFGSQAKQDQREASDIDIAVVSPYLRKEYTEGRFLLWKIRRGIDLRIEPHGFTPEDWQDEYDPMVHEIKSTGLKVA